MHFVLCSPQVWWLGALCNPMAGLEIVCSPKDAHTVSRNPIILPFPLNNKLHTQKKIQPWTNNNVAKSAPNKLALCRRRTTIVRKRGALAVKTGSRSETSGGLIPFHCFPQDYLGDLVSLFCLGSFPTIYVLLSLLLAFPKLLHCCCFLGSFLLRLIVSWCVAGPGWQQDQTETEEVKDFYKSSFPDSYFAQQHREKRLQHYNRHRRIHISDGMQK